MASPAFSFDSFGFHGGTEVYSPFLGFEREEELKAKETHETGDWGSADFDYLCSDFVYHDQQHQTFVTKDQTMFSELVDDMQFQYSMEIPSPFTSFHDPEEEMRRERKKSLASLALLSRYKSAHKIVPGKKLNPQREEMDIPRGGRELSTEQVMRLAGACYIQPSIQKDELSMLRHPFESAVSNLSEEDVKDVELAHLLLASAEKISNKQYDRARKLLTQCEFLSSSTGNPVQRVVHHFAEALRERIEMETGRKACGEEQVLWGEEIDYKMMGPHPALLACHQRLPFGKLIQFTEIQSILDHIASSKKIHLVDFNIRIGMQWIILMQALAERHSNPIERFKITAVGTSAEKIAATGRRLVTFAETLNLPLAYKEVTVLDMEDLKEDMFELDTEEEVVIYACLVFRTMVVKPKSLENVMKVIKKLKPSYMSVTEVEASHNSLSFNTRFIEALFFYSAWFDCFESFMERHDSNRLCTEGSFFAEAIRSIVATEGRERIIRHVGIDVWRSFFGRYGFVEMELNEMALYQASLIVKRFGSGGSCCTFDMNGKCLRGGWKGTPLLFVSAWKLK